MRIAIFEEQNQKFLDKMPQKIAPPQFSLSLHRAKDNSDLHKKSCYLDSPHMTRVLIAGVIKALRIIPLTLLQKKCHFMKLVQCGTDFLSFEQKMGQGLFISGHSDVLDRHSLWVNFLLQGDRL